ncbi:MAG TPA: CHAT domain-containing protein [Candidatus Angelobacter sp.]|nr:CHAT domain-containing protein [Candidatus Angelobacter sp.]
MRQINGHITAEEALHLLHVRAAAGNDGAEPEMEEHLRHCEPCRRTVEDYGHLMDRLQKPGNTEQAPPSGECVQPVVWAEVAAGLITQEESLQYLKHAASCSSCTEEMLSALAAIGSNEALSPVLQRGLNTATPEWQKEFAEQIVAKQNPARAAGRTPHPAKVRWFSMPRVWAYTGIAAVLAVSAAATFFFLHGNSPDALIHQAYAQQRTVELRIPGAGYGPIRVQRASGRSQMNSPSSLLEAEVQIKRGLESKPDDPGLLRQKAEIDLLTWNYQPALETLNHASRLQPNSFELLVDMATAYFERAEATASPADYEEGLQALGDAIRLRPDNPAALFNRAIIYERLYFYGRAIADWEQFLKVEKDSGWRKEAERHLKELREHEQHRSLRHVPDKLTVAEFKNDLANPNLTGIEEYVEAAERRILPEISASDTHSQNYQAAATLADILESRHSDRFLKDLLLAADQPQSEKAMRLLGQSSTANHEGRHEDAHASALQAAALFGKAGNTAGMLAAQFEESYALQFESKTDPCAALAGNAAHTAHENHYGLLEVQLLLEQAMCFDTVGNIGQAKELTLQALATARSHDYQSLYLRVLMSVALLEDQAGDSAKAWSSVQEGLGLYWRSDLPDVRAYSLYTALDRMAERIGHANVQFASEFESVNIGYNNPDKAVEASNRARLGNIALRVGETQVAQTQFEQAAQIFTGARQTDSIRWRELEARIGIARVQMLQGTDTQKTAASLLASLPELHSVTNRYLESQYYQTLAELKLRSGDPGAATQFLNEAIQRAETGVESLASWRERLTWMEQHRQSYLLMTDLLFRSGQEESALILWDRFRSAGIGLTPGRETVNLGQQRNLSLASVSALISSDTGIVTYALGQQGLMIWVRSAQETHAVYAQIPRDLNRTAEDFITECSRPDSDLATLRMDAQALYAWLIQPVRQWLPATGHLIIEPDGILGRLPLEALMDQNAVYLGDRYSLTMASSVRAQIQPSVSNTFPPSSRALIVAAPVTLAGGMEPPPGTRTEARRLTEKLGNSTLLAGAQARVRSVQEQLPRSEIFHFAGHAELGRKGAAMVLADGTLGSDQTKLFDSHHLSKLKLAMFSACSTARASEMLEADGLVSKFLQAGTKNVVASRWNVDSVATTDFVDLFYDSLLSGHSVADALQAAGAAFRRIPERSHPYYWAAFSAFGRA